MKDELLEVISKKLSVLIASTFMSPDRKWKIKEGVALLSRFGLSNTEIAEILGTTKSSIAVLKSRLSRKEKASSDSR